MFLFNSEGKLLLQQRAASKITFPGVWTNTCCSHPLRGPETDTPESVVDGTVPGVKRAAIRKLEHELGIMPDQVDPDNFKFLTRLHYWAADTMTHGKESPWGEHEIDYVLFIKADVKCAPNPEEVGGIQYVTLPELKAMMEPSSGLTWSPWFRIIVERFLEPWWKDLDTTLNTDKMVDAKTIHRFDPPELHMGGEGNAGPFLDVRTTFAEQLPNPSSTTQARDIRQSPPVTENAKVGSLRKQGILFFFFYFFILIFVTVTHPGTK